MLEFSPSFPKLKNSKCETIPVCQEHAYHFSMNRLSQVSILYIQLKQHSVASVFITKDENGPFVF